MPRKRKQEEPKPSYELLVGFVKFFEYNSKSGTEGMNGHPIVGRVYRIIKDDLGYRLHIGKEKNDIGLDGLFLGPTLNGEQRNFTFEIDLVTPENYITLPLTSEDRESILNWITSDNADLHDMLKDESSGDQKPVIRSVQDLLQLLKEARKEAIDETKKLEADYEDPENEHNTISDVVTKALQKIYDRDQKFITVVADLLTYIASTYGDKYEDGTTPNFSKFIVTEHPDLGKGANVFNMMKYAQRYATKGHKKSDNIEDIYKIIHYAMFELQRRKTNA